MKGGRRTSLFLALMECANYRQGTCLGATLSAEGTEMAGTHRVVKRRRVRPKAAAASALALAGRECANWQGGICLGAAIDNSYTMPLVACLLKRGLPCCYFERLILAPALKHPESAGADLDYARRLARSREEALAGIENRTERWRADVHPFARHSPAWMQRGADLRFCECGAPLQTGKRVCPACRKKRRRETKRAAQRRWRKGTPE